MEEIHVGNRNIGILEIGLGCTNYDLFSLMVFPIPPWIGYALHVKIDL